MSPRVDHNDTGFWIAQTWIIFEILHVQSPWTYAIISFGSQAYKHDKHHLHLDQNDSVWFLKFKKCHGDAVIKILHVESS